MKLQLKRFPSSAVAYEDPSHPNIYFCQSCYDDDKKEIILQPDPSQWKSTLLLCQEGHLPIKIV